MNKKGPKFKRLNRRGYTVMLIFILISMIIFWRILFSSSEASSFIRFQKKAMTTSEITVAK